MREFGDLSRRDTPSVTPQEVAAAIAATGNRYFPESAAREVRRLRDAGERIPEALTTLARYAAQHPPRPRPVVRSRSRRRDPERDPDVWLARFRRAML